MGLTLDRLKTAFLYHAGLAVALSVPVYICCGPTVVLFMQSLWFAAELTQLRAQAAGLRSGEHEVGDVARSSYAQLQRYPLLLRPLLHERDLYLAWCMKRSAAVSGCDTVVAVVGRAHMRGVLFALQTDRYQGVPFSQFTRGRHRAASGSELWQQRAALAHDEARRIAQEAALAAVPVAVWWLQAHGPLQGWQDAALWQQCWTGIL
jgi:hypothetical protein